MQIAQKSDGGARSWPRAKMTWFNFGGRMETKLKPLKTQVII